MIWGSQSQQGSDPARPSEVVKCAMAYRSRLDIQASILEAAKYGESKTRIMYRANLSYLQITSYLHELIDAGFVEQNANRIYRTSTRGDEFLRSYRRLCSLIEESQSVQPELLVHESEAVKSVSYIASL